MKAKIPGKTKTKFGLLLLLTVVTLFIGTVFYHYIENWSWVDSLYFSVVTLTTIGYGDFAPTIMLSKIFTIVYIITGIGIILGFINLVVREKILSR